MKFGKQGEALPFFRDPFQNVLGLCGRGTNFFLLKYLLSV